MRNSFFKNFLSLIMIRKRTKYKNKSINGFNTYLLKSFNIQGWIVLQKGKYWQLYYTFFDSYSNRRQILMHIHNYQQLCNTFFIFDFRSIISQNRFITHFLSVVSLRNISDDKLQFLNSMFIHLFSFKMIRNKF